MKIIPCWLNKLYRANKSMASVRIDALIYYNTSFIQSCTTFGILQRRRVHDVTLFDESSSIAATAAITPKSHIHFIILHVCTVRFRELVEVRREKGHKIKDEDVERYSIEDTEGNIYLCHKIYGGLTDILRTTLHSWSIKWRCNNNISSLFLKF
jgi:hypothetical protein